jgi:hypothetical protein
MHKVAGLANSPGRLLDMPSRRHHRLSLLQKYMGAEGARLADKDRADHQAGICASIMIMIQAFTGVIL